MIDHEVFDPRGATEIERLHAPRLDRLAGKRIGFLSNEMWQAPRMFPLLRDRLAALHPDAAFVDAADLPRGMKQIDTDEAADAVLAAGLDAVVVGNAS